MACTCEHEAPPPTAQSPRYRRILWLALVLNAAMFVVELAGSQRADSPRARTAISTSTRRCAPLSICEEPCCSHPSLTGTPAGV